mmetsp:Transcript_22143/g.34393  ORF Transcript_22143/g.34393 Transcript_22143/m.34393 type:complete len:196 (+) Transcript_22143:134-721(+)
MPYEEVDHHADVMLHVWGKSFPSVLSDAVQAMSAVFLGLSNENQSSFSEVSTLKMKFLQVHRLRRAWKRWMTKSNTREAEEGNLLKSVFQHDFVVSSFSAENLLYRVLDEYLYLISTSNICCVWSNFGLAHESLGTQALIKLKCILKNVRISQSDLSAGIEIKAVTKHNLRVTPSLDGKLTSQNSRWDAWFVLDV